MNKVNVHCRESVCINSGEVHVSEVLSILEYQSLDRISNYHLHDSRSLFSYFMTTIIYLSIIIWFELGDNQFQCFEVYW